jgi:hypothetical protein
MADRAWTLTLTYINGSVSLTGPAGEPVDKTIYRGETDTLTIQPGTGVRSVLSITITSPSPLPSGVSLSQEVKNNNLIVTDIDTLASDADEVDVVYCVNFIDSSGRTLSSDPKLINMPSVRPA